MLVADAASPAPMYKVKTPGAPIKGISAGAVKLNVSILTP